MSMLVITVPAFTTNAGYSHPLDPEIRNAFQLQTLVVCTLLAKKSDQALVELACERLQEVIEVGGAPFAEVMNKVKATVGLIPKLVKGVPGLERIINPLMVE